MGQYDDTVNSFAGEDGTVTLPEDVLTLLGAAYNADIESTTAEAGNAARSDISAIISEAVRAAVDGVKAEAFDALLERGVPDNTESVADGSENDESDNTDADDIEDLFRS